MYFGISRSPLGSQERDPEEAERGPGKQTRDQGPDQHHPRHRPGRRHVSDVRQFVELQTSRVAAQIGAPPSWPRSSGSCRRRRTRRAAAGTPHQT